METDRCPPQTDRQEKSDINSAGLHVSAALPNMSVMRCMDSVHTILKATFSFFERPLSSADITHVTDDWPVTWSYGHFSWGAAYLLYFIFLYIFSGVCRFFSLESHFPLGGKRIEERKKNDCCELFFYMQMCYFHTFGRYTFFVLRCMSGFRKFIKVHFDDALSVYRCLFY